MTKSMHTEVTWLLSRTRPLLRYHFLAVGLTIAANIFALSDPLLLKWIIDDVIPSRSLPRIASSACLLLLVYLLRAATGSASRVLHTYVGQRVAFSLRRDLLRAIDSSSAQSRSHWSVGDLLHCISADARQLEEVAGLLLPSAVTIIASGVITLLAMLYLDWTLTLLILPLVPLLFVAKRCTTERLHGASERASATASRLTDFLQEHVSDIRTVQLLGAERAEMRRLLGLARLEMSAIMRRRVVEQWVMASTLLIFSLSMVVLLTVGGYQVSVGTLSLGGFVAFYSYAGRLMNPVSDAVELHSSLQRALASVRRLRALIAIRSKRREALIEGPCTESGPKLIRFHRVTYSYESSPPVLRGVSFSVDYGERVALVGRTGSGKSTIVGILGGLLESGSGEARVRGRLIETIDRKLLRSDLGIVSQQSSLFNMSVRENLLLGVRSASSSELTKVLQICQLEETCGQFPRGLDEEVGARGCRLSGGERQKVVLARALLRRPKVLVLDEATSALDNVTEESILRDLAPLDWLEAILLISHRRSTVLSAYHVVFLEDGTIAAEGSHESMLKNIAFYRQLWSRLDKSGDPDAGCGSRQPVWSGAISTSGHDQTWNA